MTIAYGLKRIGEPFDPRTGFYALTTLLFLNTYISIYKNSFLVEFSMNFENIVIYLLFHFAFLHLLPPIGRAIILFFKLFLSRLLTWILRYDLFEEFKFFPELKRQDDYYSVYTITNLYQLSNAPFLNKLLEQNEQEIKQFQQLQNGLFSFAVLLLLNFFNSGVIANVLNLTSNKVALALFCILILGIFFLSVAEREFKIRLDHVVYKRLQRFENRLD